MSSNPVSIKLDIKYNRGDETPVFLGASFAEVRLHVAGRNLTSYDDYWESVAEPIRHNFLSVSTYPLALWAVGNWWRLTAESSVIDNDSSWKRAHNLDAAEYGYMLPPLTISESDGKTILLSQKAENYSPAKPHVFITELAERISLGETEEMLKSLIHSTITQLHNHKLFDSELETNWREVLSEINDPDVALYRKVEAQLGYDPDEAQVDLMKSFFDLHPLVGDEAWDELANARQQRALGEYIDFIRTSFSADTQSVSNVSEIRTLFSKLPMQQGSLHSLTRKLANILRTNLNLSPMDTVSDDCLSHLLGSDVEKIYRESRCSSPFGWAFHKGGNAYNIHLSEKYKYSQRFELCRFLLEFIRNNSPQNFIASKSRTFRQKLQRSFAAHFLCPVDGIRQFLNDDYSTNAIEEAARHFNAFSSVISNQLKNASYA